MDGATLLSNAGALLPPPLPPVRRARAVSAGSLAPPSKSSFRTWRGRTGLAPVRKFTWRCGAAGGGGGGITEIDESQFSETVLKSDRPVLVEFIANWCGPCRLISPAMEWLAQEYKERLIVVKIDHDANPKLIEEYKVYGLPTLILFKNGKEVLESRREGAITKVKLKEYLDSLLDSISVA
ncbi:thioredoxin X, chloroplastic [Rhodamnia argentea]|uniref:Thioredoxin X, chloroplastic n=1 Tax=Rhodamnia argentea TaxID=178133 RepID=A0ABM3HVC9_9MYRT|nr:thioredoxin X, chloroplastic [Rhodamnia argentea]